MSELGKCFEICRYWRNADHTVHQTGDTLIPETLERVFSGEH